MKICHVLVVLLCLFIQACTPAELPKVGLSLPTQRDERWVRDKEAMRMEAQRLGIDLEISIGDNNAANQIQQCEALLDKGVKVLILGPHDSKSSSTIVELAHRRNVPVIAYDRLILNADVDLYISFDNEEVGRIQAQYLLEHAPSGGYILLSGSPTDNNATLFKAGAMSLLEPKINSGEIELLLDEAIMDWQPIEAYKLTKKVLSQLIIAQRLNELSAVLAPNDNTARAVIAALEEVEMAGKVLVTGQDGEIESAKMVMAGQQSMTVFKDTRKLAKKALEMSLAMLDNTEAISTSRVVNNGLVDVKTILIKPILVTQDNLEQVFIQGGYIRAEDIYEPK